MILVELYAVSSGVVLCLFISYHDSFMLMMMPLSSPL
jgi:hypothetical protein